ncbi:MAG: hypothetical protein HEQ20_09020 [Aphanizomenon flos-aquae KM1D3_PB]|uniref:hypothetical protein n=1 Tax=Aphanizomenon flos-aquae TaxID=1176 RepID=UPI0013631E4C|nr:hypothetical protein [Aphanizomenon flos-aquae]QSV69365.1 MAG: hypothetical protein HEQ20_09020 [Aphanizomenon flos-aquae KM1D3_PB]
METIVYNPCPVRVLLSSILNYHKRDARAIFWYSLSSGLYESGKSQILDPRLLKEVGYLSMNDRYSCILRGCFKSGIP